MTINKIPLDVRCNHRNFFKVAICHAPPGNPSKKSTIYVYPEDVEGHLNHGDTLGECE